MPATTSGSTPLRGSRARCPRTRPRDVTTSSTTNCVSTTRSAVVFGPKERVIDFLHGTVRASPPVVSARRCPHMRPRRLRHALRTTRSRRARGVTSPKSRTRSRRAAVRPACVSGSAARRRATPPARARRAGGPPSRSRDIRSAARARLREPRPTTIIGTQHADPMKRGHAEGRQPPRGQRDPSKREDTARRGAPTIQ